ncbi:MAG TPA: DUF1194 domain-containing protein [Xanthobacteraceae bacterium]|nr:DUF1194 domain-containing protein [Xanthobacteraceae bacterium]
MIRFVLRIFILAAAGFILAADANSQTGKREPVDVELIIAVDISYSMDPDEQALQRGGYVDAISSKEFIDAVRKGPSGRIAVTYFEWASVNEQKVIVPWQIIDGPEAAGAFVQTLNTTPIRRASRTSIAGALIFATGLFEQSPYQGLRRVIDVSGDGTNNQGPLIEPTRDEVVARGVTINGLPIMLKEPNVSFLDIPDLDHYYEDCVIGGPGAFVVPARGRDNFVDAIRRKLLLEVAGPTPEHARVIPAVSPPRVSCTIGEQMWRERWGAPN